MDSEVKARSRFRKRSIDRISQPDCFAASYAVGHRAVMTSRSLSVIGVDSGGCGLLFGVGI